MHLLEQELKALIKKDDYIFNFIEDNALDGLWYWDLKNFESSWTNDKFWNTLGYTRKEVINKSLSWHNLANKDDVKKTEACLKKLIENPEKYPFNETLRYTHKKGHTVWLHSRATLLLDKDNNPHRILGTYTCVTKLRETEIKLQKNIKHYENVIEGANIGTWEYNIEADSVKYNERWAGIFGYKLEELQPITSSSWISFVHPNDIEAGNKALQNHRKGIEYYNFEFRMKHKLGHWVWVLSHGKVMKYDATGKPILLAGSHYDITKRKQNELKLTHFKNLLEQSNKTAQIGHWEVNLKNNTVFWSDVTKNIHETPIDYIPTLDGALDFYPEGIHRDNITKAVDTAFEKGENYDLELQIKTLKGNLKWVRAIGITERTEENQVKLFGLFQDIDAIKKAELQIALKEEQWRSTFNHSKTGMALISLDGHVQKANQSLCNILGYTEAEMKEMTIEDITFPEDLNETYKFMEEVISGKRDGYNFEKRYITKEGNTIWTNATVAAVKNDNNEFTHVVAQVIDITESKTNELLLHKYKQELEHSNQMAKIGSWEIDVKNNNKVIWNSALKTILEVPQDYTPIFENIIDFHPEDKHREIVMNAMTQIRNHGGNLDVTVQINTHKNHLKWVRIIGISDFKNNDCQRLYGLFQDIDDIKKAEQEVALREEQFRQTFWHSNVGMTLLDLNGKVTRANPYICKIFGYTEEEIINTPIPEFSHPEDSEKSQSLMKEIIAGKRDNFQIEKRYFHKNGDIVWASLSTSGVKNDKGELSHIVSQIVDITENKLLTESLKEHNNRLVNFAHIVSHNLRSHTGNMAMLLDISKTSNPDLIDDEIFQHLKTSSENMNDTVHYLSEIVEINTKVKDTMLSLNLKEYVNKAVQNVQVSLSKINCKLQINIDENLMVMAVPAYLDSIILNLFTNALKYHSPERQPEIVVNSDVSEKFISLAITDNGQGIDLERHGDKLFGMYKTFHNHKDARGIGLFISKNQIEAMGGKIEVQSIVNQGTTFKIYFKYEHSN